MTKKELRSGWFTLVATIGSVGLVGVIIPIWKGWPFNDAALVTLLSIGFLALSYYIMMSEDGD